MVDVRQNEGSVTINFDVFGFYSNEVIAGDDLFTSLSVPECGNKGQVGQPYMPFKSLLVPIPNGPRIEGVSVIGDAVSALQQVQVSPTCSAEPECGTAERSCGKDPEFYQQDQWVPEDKVRIVEDATVRGQRFLVLEVFPLLFNPAREEIVAYPHQEITIHFSGAVNQAAETMKLRRSKAFFQTIVSPDSTASETEQWSAANPSGIEYLIVAHDDFVAAMEPLVTWKRLKGYTIELVPISVVGSTSTAIKSYLQNRYNNDPDLTYVLLVGDHAQVPAESAGGHVTDLYYSCLDGSDLFPDIVIGRISVQTASDCTNIVEKILSHDQSPDTGLWRGDFLMAALLQDYDNYNCEADRWFFETGTHVMHYVRDTIGMGIYTAATSDNLSCTPYNWRSDSYPHRFSGYAGQSVPADDAALITDKSTATQDVKNAINAGVSLVQHRDHGGQTSWGDPHFGISDINSLSNGTMYPVVYSINCLTGTFNYGSDCFAEAFMKKYPGGAVGVIAATDLSYSGYNDLLVHGAYDCFWDDYDPANGANIYPHSFRPAEALMYGKYHMYTWEGVGSITTSQFEIFHWFSEPELMVYTEAPQVPTVMPDCPVPLGTPDLEVVCDVEGAMVAVTDHGVLLGRAYCTGGQALVTMDPSPASPTTLDVVVTGHNLVPWLGTCEIIAPNGPWFIHDSHLIDDIAGNGDGIVNPGESFVLPITVKNIGTEPGSGITALLSSNSTDCAVTDSEASFPDIPVALTGQSLPDHYAITVAPTAAYGAFLAFTLDWNSTGGYFAGTNFAIPVCAELSISNILVTEITDTTARISWTTNVPATSRVSYGATAPPALFVEDLAITTSHSMILSGLDQCVSYVFEVMSESPDCYQITDSNGGSYYLFETAAPIIFLSEDYEGAAAGWTHSGTYDQWQIGVPTSGPGTAHGGTSVYATNLSGSYTKNNGSTNGDNWLSSQSIDLSGTSAAFLNFWHWYDIYSDSLSNGSDDGAWIEVSTDGGSSWQVVTPENGYNNTLDDEAPYPSGPCWAGTSAAWELVEVDLTPFAGSVITLRFRFFEDDDYGTAGAGWYIDDLEVKTLIPCGPYPVFESQIALDAPLGNNDGIVDPGENVNMTITLKNLGTENALDVIGHLSTTTPGITVEIADADFPDIDAFGTGQSNSPRFMVDPSVPCGTIIEFDMTVDFNDPGGSPGQAGSSFTVQVGFGVPTPICNPFSEIYLDREMYSCEDIIGLRIVDPDLNINPGALDTATAEISSDSEPIPEFVTLTETGPDTGAFEASISNSLLDAPGVLQVNQSDGITALYHDVDAGGNGPQDFTASASVAPDCTMPVISNVRVTDIGGTIAIIRWETDEAADSMVEIGATPALTSTVFESALVTSHAVFVDGLSRCDTQFFRLTSTDQYLNTTIDDNGGSLFTFNTGGDIEFLSENFEALASGWAHSGTYDQWEIGTPASGPGNAHGGSGVYATNLSGPYTKSGSSNNGDNSLLSPEFDLNGTFSATLSFWHWFDISTDNAVNGTDDGAWLEISTDGGSSWQVLTPGTGYNNTLDDEAPYPFGPCWAGTTADWERVEVNLSAYTGSLVTLRFRFFEDDDFGTAGDGWYIDNVQVKRRAFCGLPIFEDGFESGDLSNWTTGDIDLAEDFNNLLLIRGVHATYATCDFLPVTSRFFYLGIHFNTSDGALDGGPINNLTDLYWKNERIASTEVPYSGEDADGDGVANSADADAFESGVQ